MYCVGYLSFKCKYKNVQFASSVAGKIVFYTLMFVLGIAFVWTGISRLQNKSRQHQTSIFQYVFGLTMEPKFTSVTWEWKDPYVVGESMSFFLKVLHLLVRCK